MFSTKLDWTLIALGGRGSQLKHTRLEAYLEPSRISAMELFCENS